MTDNIKFLRDWASDIREGSGVSTDADKLEEIAAMLEAQAAKITDLEARLRLEAKRADDAEALRDFLIKELDKLIEKARQS